MIVIGDILRTAVPGQLSVAGFRVVGHATTVQQATELLRGAQPDVALVDVGTSADPTVQAVRVLTTQAVPVVAAGHYSANLAQRGQPLARSRTNP